MNRHARKRILAVILPRVRAVCDLGCGTGTTALEFARRGLEVFAVDNSPTICRLARQKARRARLLVRFLRADMTTFRLPRRVDLVTCEFASLNHVRRKQDLGRVARAVARALRPGGYFLFDINTPRSFQEQIPTAQWFEGPRYKLVLRGRYDHRRGRARLNFEWFLPRGRLWRHVREEVDHVCWRDAEIRSTLRRAGFRRLRVWDGVEVRPPSTQVRRGYDTYYLAQRPFDPRRN